MTTTYNGRDIVARTTVRWVQYCGDDLTRTALTRRGIRKPHAEPVACAPGGWLDGPKPRAISFVAVYSGTVTRMPLGAWRRYREAA